MFGFMKSPAKPNPCEADTESDTKKNPNPARRATSEPVLVTPNSKSNFFDDDDDDDFGRGASSRNSAAARGKNQGNKKALQDQTMEELEGYAVNKAEEVTKDVNNCLRIAENIREDATRTLDMLHEQGEQITRTHQMVADTEKDLSRGEKLLNSLGGMFSMLWKPKKGKEIAGPLSTPDKLPKKADKEKREKLGLAPAPKGSSSSKTHPEPTNAMQKVEVEKAKQDDALSDLSNILGDLKGMAVDMGSELDRQNQALDHLSDDVDELNSRVKGANQRARKLLAK